MKGLKTGGRVQGTPNAITADLRSKINAIVEKQFDNIEADLNALEPKDRLNILEKFFSYCMPKMVAQTFEVDFGQLNEEQLNQIINSININDNDRNE